MQICVLNIMGNLIFYNEGLSIYLKNNSGPGIDPCGTPAVIICVLDYAPLYATYLARKNY